MTESLISLMSPLISPDGLFGFMLGGDLQLADRARGEGLGLQRLEHGLSMTALLLTPRVDLFVVELTDLGEGWIVFMFVLLVFSFNLMELLVGLIANILRNRLLNSC